MKIAFNPSTVAALITPPNNKDITFDLRGRNIFARGVKFCGTDTNTWRDIKINNVSIGSNTLDLRNGSNTTLTNTNGVVTINSTWRPVVDNLTSDSTTSSLSAKQGKVLKSLIDGKSDSGHNHDDRYVKKSGDTMSGVLTIDTTNFGALTIKRNDDANGASIQFRGKSSVYGYIGLNNSTKDKQFLRWGSDTSKTYTILDTSSTYVSNGKGIINGTTITLVSNADTTDGVHLEWSGQLTYDLYSWLAGWTNDGKKIKAVNKSLFATSGHTHDNRYLKLSGGTMQLGEGLKFHADENYFGTDLDARIISLLDWNGKICDGGLIIDERATFDGKEYVTELLRIRDSEFKWKGSNILHSGNSNINGNTITINGSSLTVSKSDHTHAYLPLSGGTMTGSIKFNYNSLPQKTLSYVCGIDAFVDGGEMGWMRGSDFVVQYAPTKTGLGASGTWDINITGDADTVDGVHVIWNGSITKTNWLAAWENYTTIRCISPANVTVGNSDKVDGFHATSGNNKPWGTIPAITTNGLMDVGKQFEFHYDNTTGSDYSTILRCTGNYSNIIDLPSISGTLALTSQIPNVTNYYWANIKISDTSNSNTAPTFGSAIINTRLSIAPSTLTKTSPTSLQLVINGPYFDDSVTPGLKDWPGIGFHMPGRTWGSLIFNGNITAINSDYNGYVNYYGAGFRKNGSSDSYVLLGGGGHKALSDFMSSTVKYALSDTIGGKALLAYKLYYSTSLKDLASIDNFHEAYTLKCALWNGNLEGMGSSFPGTINGIILSGGWTDTKYGFQLAIDDDPNYFIALRQRNKSTWYTWKRIPMGDGTGASGTWGINITGNADTVDGYHANGLLTALSNSNNGVSITVGGTTKSISNISVNYANSAGNADKLDGLDSTKFLRQVVVPNNTENDFNTFSNMTLTGRADPTTGASLKNAPWSGSGPAGGYGVLTYLFSGAGYGTQMAWRYNSNRIYIRNRYYGGSEIGAVWGTSWDTLALTTDIPTSLKNPHALTISLNGTSQGPYDGSAAKNINITPGSIGAATSEHNHTYIVATDKRDSFHGQILSGSGLTLSLMNGTRVGINSDYCDAIIFDSWIGPTAGESNALMFAKGNTNVYHTQVPYKSTTSWGTPIKFWDSNNLKNVSQLTNDSGYITSSGSCAYATSAGFANGIANKGLLDSLEKIDNFITANRFEYAIFKTTESNNVGFASNDGMILSIPWSSRGSGAQIAFDDTLLGTVKVRGKNGSWGNWHTLLHSGNYNNYAPSKTGTGASGTWGINITGTAAIANKTSKTLTFTGGSTATFNGSIDISVAIPTKSSWNYDDRYFFSNVVYYNTNSGGFEKNTPFWFKFCTLPGRDGGGEFYTIIIEATNGADAPQVTVVDLVRAYNNDSIRGWNLVLKTSHCYHNNYGNVALITIDESNNIWFYYDSTWNLNLRLKVSIQSTVSNITILTLNLAKATITTTTPTAAYGGNISIKRVPTAIYSTRGIIDVPTIYENGISLSSKYLGISANAVSATNADMVDGYHASAFATAGHNHNDLYVSSLTTNGNYLRWVKNGNNNDITIPYATGSSKLMYHGLIGYRTDFDSFTGDNVIKVALFQNKGTDDEKLVPPFYDGSLISFPWGNDNNYGAQLAVEDGGQTNHLAIRNKSNSNTWGAWAMILTSANYNLYSPKLNGTGASGTWNINITGNATNSDTVDGVHLNWSGTNDNPIYLASWDDNGKAIRAATRANIRVGYADLAASATKVIVNLNTTNDTNYPLVWSNLANTNTVTENQLYKSWSDLYYNPKNKRLTVGGSIVASSFIKSGGTSLQLLRADGGIAAFNWSGQSGLPTWLWGGNNLHSYYVYNPSNFRVAYATSSGNADTLDGVHLSGIFTAFGNNAHNITATIGGVTKSFLVNWAADSDKLDGYHENSFLRYRETTSIDLENTLWDLIGIKLYNGALPDNLTNVYNYGSVISLPCTSTRFEIYASELASLGNGLYYRSGWRDTKRPWLKFIDSSNIGSQSVNYANSAGNADKLDGIHANGLLTSVTNTNNGISITVGGTTKSVSNISVNYANSAGNADTALYLRSLGNLNCQTGRTLNYGDVYTYNTNDGNTGSPTTFTSVIGFGRGIAGTVEIAGGWDNTNLYWRSLRDCCEDWHSWRTVLDSSNYTEYINNYYWANVKISTSSSTTTSPTVSNLTATSSIRMGNLYLLNTNEINSASGIHLNYQNSGNISLCVGGGKVGIGTTSPTYKLDVNGDIHSSGTINCNSLNVDSTLNIKDSVISCSAGNISILSKESGSLLINSREVLRYDSDFIYMNNRIDLLHGLCFRTSTLDTTYSIYTTDDVTVLIGVLRDNASFKFKPAKDGLLLFLKIGKLYSDTYFWCTAENCVVVGAKNFGIYLDKNQNKDCFGDGLARIFIYIEASNRWYEFYCG